MVDPVAAALCDALLDDEEETDEECVAVAQARQSMQRNARAFRTPKPCGGWVWIELSMKEIEWSEESLEHIAALLKVRSHRDVHCKYSLRDYHTCY